MARSDSEGWKSESGYIWSLIGSAVGFANLLGFGSQCYKYGGAAFLIPFTLALLILGVPLLMLEGVVGQRTQLPLVSAYGKEAGSYAKFWGWLSIIAVTTIGGLYIVLTGWSLVYTYYAASGSIPSDTAAFFTKDVLGATGSVSTLGSISWPVLCGTIVVIIYSWYVISRNIREGIERWCSIFLPLLTFCVLVFAVAVMFLPGAATGFLKYLTPDFRRLSDFHMWRDVFGQLFFSLSLGLGIVVGYSRHTGKETCIRSAMTRVALADFAISFVAGFVTFGCIGYMAEQQGISFDTIVADASTFEIGYVIFPKILEMFGPVFSRIVGAVFFFSVFIAGITGVFSIIESTSGNIEVEFRRSRFQAVTISTLIMATISILFCFGNGTAIIDALAPVILGDNMLIGGIAQILIFFVLSKSIQQNQAWIVKGKMSLQALALKYAGIPILVTILLFSLYDGLTQEFGIADFVRWGWLGTAILLSLALTLRPAPAYKTCSESNL